MSMSETILDFCTVCGTPSAVHVPGGLFCLQKQLAAEKALRHDAMTAYAKLEADWRAEKGLREAAEARAAGLEGLVALNELFPLFAPAPEQEGGGDGTGGDEMDRLTSGDAAKREGE
jgi:hypothetical protein